MIIWKREEKKNENIRKSFVFYTHPRNMKTNIRRKDEGKKKKSEKNGYCNNGISAYQTLVYCNTPNETTAYVTICYYWPRIGFFFTQHKIDGDMCMWYEYPSTILQKKKTERLCHRTDQSDIQDIPHICRIVTWNHRIWFDKLRKHSPHTHNMEKKKEIRNDRRTTDKAKKNYMSGWRSIVCPTSYLWAFLLIFIHVLLKSNSSSSILFYW